MRLSPRYSHLIGFSRSDYHLHGKSGNSEENLNEMVHPGGIFRKKSNIFRGITFFPFLPKQYVPYVWITSARLHVERKWKLYRYFVNGTTQSRSCFLCQKRYQYHWTEIFHRNFCTTGKRSRCIVLTVHYSSVAECLARRTRNPAVSGSSPALATCWICSRSSRLQILGHACKWPTGCLLPLEGFYPVMLYLNYLFLSICL